MLKELVVATGNRGKLRELEELLRGVVEHIRTPVDYSGFPEVIEDGETFAENAGKKARNAARFTGLPALADDSGLEVAALGGRPGVRSARFAGEGANDAANNTMLLQELATCQSGDRQASFRCVAALCFPDGRCVTFTGELVGIMLDEPRGDGGFGYDPLFLVPEYGKTLAELPLAIKNRISHRGRALALLREYVQSL